MAKVALQVPDRGATTAKRPRLQRVMHDVPAHSSPPPPCNCTIVRLLATHGNADNGIAASAFRDTMMAEEGPRGLEAARLFRPRRGARQLQPCRDAFVRRAVGAERPRAPSRGGA